MRAPPSLDAFYSLGDLQHVLASAGSKAVSYYRVRAWLLTHQVPVQRIGSRACIAKATVDSIIAQHGKSLPKVIADQPAPSAQPELVTLKAVALQLFGESGPRANMRTRKWLVRNGVALWRQPGGSFVARQQLEQALAQFGAPPVATRNGQAGRDASLKARVRKHGSVKAAMQAMRAKRDEQPAAEPAQPRTLSYAPTTRPAAEPKHNFTRGMRGNI